MWRSHGLHEDEEEKEIEEERREEDDNEEGGRVISREAGGGKGERRWRFIGIGVGNPWIVALMECAENGFSIPTRRFFLSNMTKKE